MLPKINRIKKKKDFDTIFKNSKSLKNSLFVFKIAKNNLGINRVGFIVSQKISKKATIRNKVRRRLADAVSKEIENFKSGIDLLFIALSGIEKKEFSEIKQAVGSTIIKSGLLSK